MEENKINKLFLYARKSSESDEQQTQSIDDQIRVMRLKAQNMGYKIAGIFYESKSAKAPLKRTEFYKMIEKLENNEADGIIAWKLDRLSRNPVDTGTVQYMLQTNKIKLIYTNDREYLPRDAGLMFSVETGMATQYILDLVKNVRRGLDSKYEKGIRPSRAPIGYLNDKDNKDITIDDLKFSLIRKLWDLMLTGNYNPSKLVSIANNNFGIRHKNGKILGRSAIYYIFNNIFYTGYFYFKGELKKGNHIPMITLEEYDRVQKILGKKGTTRPQNREFSYTGFVKCGECGAMITAEIKHKKIVSTGETKQYTYYHCTGRKKDANCSQKSIRIEDLEEQISNILENIEIIPQFNMLLKEILKENHADKIEQQVKAYKSINTTIINEEKKLNRLTDLLIDNIINKEEYQQRKKEIQESITRLKDERENINLKGQKDLDVTEEIFNFITLVGKSFKYGNLQTKKEIFSSLGKNFVLKNGILNLELAPWFNVVKDELPKLKREATRLELTKKAISFSKTNDFNSECSLWWVI